MWLVTYLGLPDTPTDQVWVESVFGHRKSQDTHLELIDDIDVRRAARAVDNDALNLPEG